MKPKSLLLLACGLLTFCTPHRPVAEVKSDPRFPECNDCDEVQKLYYFADTAFTRHDSLFIVNNRLDTTVIETGIFTYLQEIYPVITPASLVAPLRQGVQAETVGDSALATASYRKAISFYQNYWLKRKECFENGGFSDLNDYYAANVNIAILVSYAFEKLGHLPEARAALAPFMANVEAENSKIQFRYVQLCIRQYGKVATRQALHASGNTVFRTPSEDSPENDYWRVKVFGASLGVADFNTDTLSPQQAQAIVRQQPYYVLVK